MARKFTPPPLQTLQQGKSDSLSAGWHPLNFGASRRWTFLAPLQPSQPLNLLRIPFSAPLSPPHALSSEPYARAHQNHLAPPRLALHTSLTLTAPRDMFLPPTSPASDSPTLLVETPEQLLPLNLNDRGERARRTSLETGYPGLFELESLLETMVQQEGFGG